MTKRRLIFIFIIYVYDDKLFLTILGLGIEQRGSDLRVSYSGDPFF